MCVCCAQGHIEVLEWLIRHGAKVERDDLGGTPLHDAAEHGQKNVHSCPPPPPPPLSLSLSLLATSPSCPLLLPSYYPSLSPSLPLSPHQALKVLLSTGVDHMVQDLDGLTAADLAEECGHIACADFLREYEPPPMPDIMVFTFYSCIHLYVILFIYSCIILYVIPAAMLMTRRPVHLLPCS